MGYIKVHICVAEWDKLQVLYPPIRPRLAISCIGSPGKGFAGWQLSEQFSNLTDCGSRALRVSRRRGGMVGLFFLWASIVASEAPDGAEEDPTVPTKEELCCFKDSDVDIQCAVYNFNSLLNLQLLFRAMRCVVRSQWRKFAKRKYWSEKKLFGAVSRKNWCYHWSVQ